MSNANAKPEAKVWREIPGYHGKYVATTCGLVGSRIIKRSPYLKSIDSPYLLKQFRQRGYPMVAVSGRNNFVHRIIAKTFLTDFDEGLQVNHIDGNKENNHVDNLEMCDQFYNQWHSVYKLGKRRPNKLSDERILELAKIYSEGKSMSQVANIAGVSKGAIIQLFSRRLKNYNTVIAKDTAIYIACGYAKNKRSSLNKFASDLLAKLESDNG